MQTITETKSVAASKSATTKKSVIAKQTGTRKPPAALMKAVKKSAQLMRKFAGNELTTRYKVGTLVLKQMKNATYGDKAVALFAKALNLSSNTLLAHAAVARIWEKAEFTALSKRCGDEDGDYRLSWSHFVLLAGVEDGRTRNALIDAAFAESLSEKALRARLAGSPTAGKSSGAHSAASDSTDVASTALELEEVGARLSALLDESTEEDSDTTALAAALEVLARVEGQIADARTRIALALAANDQDDEGYDGEEVDVTGQTNGQAPAPVLWLPSPGVQAPAPYNAIPATTIAQAVAEVVQMKPGYQMPAPVQLPQTIRAETQQLPFIPQLPVPVRKPVAGDAEPQE